MILIFHNHLFHHVVGSVGSPAGTVEVKVVDPEEREVPVGETGEIIIRGPNVMKGYLNNPDETSRTLRGGWLHSGDVGRFDERGYLYIVDRIKDLIITGGLNVYPREVEEVLYTHDAVEENLDAVEKLKTVHVNMGTWFTKGKSPTCHVCLAGAVMYKKSDAKRNRFSVNPEWFSTRWETVFNCLETLRSGEIARAVILFSGGRPGLTGLTDVFVTHYTKNKKKFKKDMQKVLKILKENNF